MGRDVSYYVLIRGPLGAGKTTVARVLATRIGGEYISIDRILDEHHLEEWENDYISEGSFLRANRIVADLAGPRLAAGVPVVIDGNFYYRAAIEDLQRRLDFPSYVFTLKVPLEVCIERDRRRAPSLGREATEEVYVKSTEFAYGMEIDATAPLDAVVTEVVARLRPA